MKTINKKNSLLMMAALLAGTMTFGAVDAAQAATPAKSLAQVSQMKLSSISEPTDDTRVFAVDKSVEAKSVRFQNRYGRSGRIAG